MAVSGIGLLGADRIAAQRPNLKPAALLAQHEEASQAFWTPADPDYPALLFAISDPPPVLYYRGSLRFNAQPIPMSVGIVGTRQPSAYGRRWTQRLSAALAAQGTTIVSGLAAGIDTEAHESCLKQGGCTVAVLGTGVDVVYPQQNRELYRQILETGLVVSEYADKTLPDKAHFPRRNRLIAGLSRAVLVTEAPERSGALITARLANDYCREVYALPSGLDNERGRGCLDLIAQGAQIILGEHALLSALAEIPPTDNLPLAHGSQRGTILPSPSRSGALRAMAVPPRGDIPRADTPANLHNSSPLAAAASELSPSLRTVLQAISIEPTLLDHIVQSTQLGTGEVLAALMQLELMGLVSQLPGMQYQRL